MKPMRSPIADDAPATPLPPASRRFLLAAAYVTTAAIYAVTLLAAPELRQSAVWPAFTALFASFALTISFMPDANGPLWQRGGPLLLQAGLIFAILLVGRGDPYLPILYFIVVPAAYLRLTFRQASGFTLLCAGALFLDYLLLSDVETALAMLFSYGGGFVFFIAVSVSLTQQQRERQRAERLLAELEAAHRRLQAYAVQVEALAVAEERNRLAREIHDSLGHYLTTITVQLEAARKLIATQPGRAAESIAKAEYLARESLAEVRRSVAALRATPLDTAALGEAIGEVVESLRVSGIVTTFTIEGETHPLPIQTKTALYRAAQEGLTNVRKHASASAVQVTLTYEPEWVMLTISDNGIGRRGEETEGFGLLGLRERVALLGGSVKAGDCPEGGFRLRVEVPGLEVPTPTRSHGGNETSSAASSGRRGPDG
ncbi:MAG: sensor histidine kinase [Anaerolineae bacterium]|nr:sensor histidine kinase [Anaerolineae bacterium]